MNSLLGRNAHKFFIDAAKEARVKPGVSTKKRRREDDQESEDDSGSDEDEEV